MLQSKLKPLILETPSCAWSRIPIDVVVSSDGHNYKVPAARAPCRSSFNLKWTYKCGDDGSSEKGSWGAQVLNLAGDMMRALWDRVPHLFLPNPES